jgi:hypothetical protein
MSGGFDPVRAIDTLLAHRVRFLVIGGYAGNLRGSPLATFDLDICYARDAANLQALARALTSLRARLRGAPADVPFILDPRSLREADRFTFTTDAGSLDLLGTPDGVTSGYDELARAAEDMELGSGVTFKVAALEDLV